MLIEQFNLFFKNTSNKIGKHSPTILTGIAVAGTISAVISAVNDTPKAIILIDQMKEEKTNINIIKAAWTAYIPTAIITGVTISCILFSNTISLKRNAALASVYSITKKALNTYENKVIDLVGKNKNQKIKDEIASDKLKENPLTNEVVIIGNGDILCYDSLSGRYFNSNIEEIKKIQNEFNIELIHSLYISLNDFYYALGLSGTKLGDEIGWNLSDGLIEINFSTQLAENGKPCLVLDYITEPKFRFDMLG